MHPLTTLLLAQRSGHSTILHLPEDLVPNSLEEAYRVQSETVTELGPIGGWKVSAFDGDAVPFCSPLPASSVFASGSEFARSNLPGLGVEVEIGVTFARDLPGDAAAEDVVAAIGSFHVVFELLSSRYVDRKKVPPLAAIADLQSNGAVVVGPPMTLAILPEFGGYALTLEGDGASITPARHASPDTANFVASLTWLANHAAGRDLPLRKGDVVITGARLGPEIFAGRTISARGEGLGAVVANFV